VCAWCATVAILAAMNMAAEGPAPRKLEPVELRVRLLAPMTSNFTRKGDLVSAKVLDSGWLQGGILEGDVRDVRAGTSGKHASIQFQFHTLHASGATILISARLLRLTGSGGRDGLDDEGQAVEIDQHGEHGGGLRSVASALHVGSGKQDPSRAAGPIRISTNAANLTLGVGGEFAVHVEPKEQ